MRKKSEKILILTEAGDKIGFGHYTRCSAIQNSLKLRGLDCKMILNLVGTHSLPIDGFFFDWLNSRSKLKFFLDQGYTKVLIDSYLANSDDYRWLRNTFQKSFSIDDYNRITYATDLVINPNVFGLNLDYLNQNMATIYGGKDYVILREVFRNGSFPKLKEKIRKVVITVGGSDYRNLIPRLVPIVQSSLPTVKVSVVAGNPTLQGRLQMLFKKVDILGLLTAQEMYDVFYDADIVISGCGQTLHELASMGKPTIGICLDIDQEPNQEFYYQVGFLKEKIQFDDLNPINELLTQLTLIEERKKLQEIGLKAINKNGVEKISKLLLS